MEFSIRDFNHIVNNSENLERKYKQWSSYRENIRGLIERGMELKPGGGEVIILGAGACNDIDIKFLVQNFEKVFLTDIDMKTMEEGLKRQGIKPDETEKIHLIEVDYTGLEKTGFFNSFSRKIFGGLPVKAICSFIDEGFKELSDEVILREYWNRFDMVLSAPIYTQLAVTQFTVILESAQRMGLYDRSSLRAVYEKIYQYVPKLLYNYNSLLVSLCKEGGILVSWMDMVETDSKSSLIKEFVNQGKGEEKINEAAEDYLKHMGKGMAEIGREDLLQRTEKEYSKWMLWPFSTERNILVYGYLGRK